MNINNTTNEVTGFRGLIKFFKLTAVDHIFNCSIVFFVFLAISGTKGRGRRSPLPAAAPEGEQKNNKCDK